jgi:putative flippase GtrA
VLGDAGGPPPGEGGPHRVRPSSGLRLQLLRFVAVGVVSTIAYILLYLALRGTMGALEANALSLLATAVANTAVNRRFTFGVRGRQHVARHQARGLLAFAAALLLTTVALLVLTAMSPSPGVAAEVTALVIANLLATGLRFGLYRRWVFDGRRPAPPGPGRAVPPPQAAAPLAGMVLPRPGGAGHSGGGGR